MATMTSTPHPVQQALPEGLRVSHYERAASGLISLLILLGVLVFFLFVAWLGSRIIVHKPPIKVEAVQERIEQVGGGTSDGFVGEGMELNSPQWQDIAAETDLVNPEINDTLTQVVQTVSNRRSIITDASLANPFEEQQQGGTIQKGTGNRPGWGHGTGLPGLPPHMRWEIRFGEGNTLDTYAQLLDYFGIQLGVVGTEATSVTVISNLAQPQPLVEVKLRADLNAVMYMQWKKGSELIEADRQLAQKAGVNITGTSIIQFYPDATEQRLLRLELDFKGVPAGQIKKTVFEVVADGSGGHQFQVVAQTSLAKGSRPGTIE